MDSQDSLNYWLCGAHYALLFSLKSVFPVFHWQRQRPGECQLFEKVRLGYATHFDGGGGGFGGKMGCRLCRECHTGFHIYCSLSIMSVKINTVKY
jgi:hypothetical protein